MTVLVTGAAGFLGKHLVRALLADGYTVAGVDNFITSDRRDLAPLLTHERFSFKEMDITTPEFAAHGRSIEPEAIFHLGCPTGVPNLVPMALEMLEASYEGTKAVLEIARGAECPAVVTSSAEVYGEPLVSPQTEEYTGNVDTLGPRMGYEEGKRVAETLFGIYAQKYGVPAKIVRVFNTYGPGMSLDDTRVVPSFVKAALTGRPLRLHGDGEQNRCHTHASDMVRALRTVLANGTPGRAYNAGSQKQVTVRALAELVVQLTGTSSPIERIPRPAHDHTSRLPETARIRAELGWEMTVPLDAGLRETIADFRTRLAERGEIPEAA